MKWLRILIVASVAASLLACNARRNEPSAAENTDAVQYKLSVGGEERNYLLHVPPGYEQGRAVPLVLVYHGGFGNAQMMMELTEMNRRADRHGFIVAYPNGSGRFSSEKLLTWNAGDCCGYAVRKGVDDVAFTRALIDDIARRYSIDTGRVFATGHSNGAMLVYRLACELSDRIAGIAPVAGTLEIEQCRPERAIPVLHFHGTADQNVPMGGGQGADSRAGVSFRPIAETLGIMRDIHQCDDSPKVRTQGDATFRRWDCRRGGPVTLVVIDRGGHNWPGGPLRKGKGDEYTSRSIHASDTMWEYFQENAR